MGGTAAVSQEVEDAIRDMHIATVRVAGADRQATSVQAFNLIDGNWYKQHGTHSVIIATGANYADALSISPFAYATGTPILLTKADGTLTDEAVKAIKDNDEIWQVIVVGGTEAVQDNVFSALGTYTGSYRDYYKRNYIAVRIAGTDRYDTSAKIADWEINFALDTGSDPINGVYSAYGVNYLGVDKSVPIWADFGFDEVFVATGENFPDALAGGQLAGGKYYSTGANAVRKNHSPILLTKDGNRSADSVIASNLAWNPTYYSVNATEYTSLDAYVDILDGSYTEFAYGLKDGFWSIVKYDPYNTTSEFEDGAFNFVIVNDLGTYKYNNFHGIILGGKAAVSKDKAKQLDTTVDDTIRKYYDMNAYDEYYVWFNNTFKTSYGKYYTTWGRNGGYNGTVISGLMPGSKWGAVAELPGNLEYFYYPVTGGSETMEFASVSAGTGYFVTTQLFDVFENSTSSLVGTVKLVVAYDTNDRVKAITLIDAIDEVTGFDGSTFTVI
jgi:hypothetical protein